jgi:hypothetical protein
MLKVLSARDPKAASRASSTQGLWLLCLYV